MKKTETILRKKISRVLIAACVVLLLAGVFCGAAAAHEGILVQNNLVLPVNNSPVYIAGNDAGQMTAGTLGSASCSIITAGDVMPLPETDEEIEALINDLREHQDKMVVVAAPAGKKDAVEKLLKEAESEGVIKQIALDLNAGNISFIEEIINDAGEGYSAVHFIITPDNKDIINQVLTAVDASKVNIHLPKDGSMVSAYLSVIENYPKVQRTISAGFKAAAGTVVENTTRNTVDDIADIISAAKKTATSDNICLILTEKNKEHVRDIIGAYPGVLIEATKLNKGILFSFLDEELFPSLTVNQDNLDVISSLATDPADLRVAVTPCAENKEYIASIISDKCRLVYKFREDGTNISDIIELDGISLPRGFLVPPLIILSNDITLTVKSDTLLLEMLLSSIDSGNTLDKVTLNLDNNEKIVSHVTDVLGQKDLRGNLVKLTGLPENVIIVTPAKGEAASFGDYHVVFDSRYINDVALVSADGVSSIAASRINDRLIGTDIMIGLPGATPGYENAKVYSVFQFTGVVNGKSSPVLTIDVYLKNPSERNNLYLKNYNIETKEWETSHIAPTGSPKPVSGKTDTYRFTYQLPLVGPYALVYETLVHKSSGSKGTSVWAVSTQSPTETPTPAPTETPTVLPTPASVLPSPTPAAKSPMPFAGILAGLGAAAAVLVIRRK